MMGRIYGRKAMYREALLAFDRATELGGSLVVRAAAGYTLAASGRRDEARAILNQLKTRAAQAYATAVEHRARPPRPGRAGGGAQPARRGRRRARPAPDVSDRGASLGRPGRPSALHRLARKGRPETVARVESISRGRGETVRPSFETALISPIVCSHSASSSFFVADSSRLWRVSWSLLRSSPRVSTRTTGGSTRPCAVARCCRDPVARHAARTV